MESLLENCIHETMRTVLFFVSRFVADESKPLKPGFSGYLIQNVNETLLYLHALVGFPCEPECEVSQFCERFGCLPVVWVSLALGEGHDETKRAHAFNRAT